MATVTQPNLDEMKKLSPKRNSTEATSVEELVDQQLEHFGISEDSEYGQTLARIVQRMYESQGDVAHLWKITLDSLHSLDQPDRIKRFNAKKFLSFQLAKILDTLQNPFRKSYQALGYSSETSAAKGPYPVFDNVTALFSATPVITRTATYIYACAEWIEDAFNGEELMLEIYSRSAQPNQRLPGQPHCRPRGRPLCGRIHGLEFQQRDGRDRQRVVSPAGTGRRADQQPQRVRRCPSADPRLVCQTRQPRRRSRRRLTDTQEKNSSRFLKQVQEKYADRLARWHAISTSISNRLPIRKATSSTCAGISKVAHQHGLKVMLDATVATPFLYRPLQREDEAERPDFVIHSYTKDLSGCGAVIAGCVIGRNLEMFIPKGQTIGDKCWDQTMFWNVYYVKGAFLNADAAFEVMQGMKTLPLRMLQKCINTQILADVPEFPPQYPRPLQHG